ncbi:hypothetical protein NFI96_017073, partial [Prochilodus magdalenae]
MDTDVVLVYKEVHTKALGVHATLGVPHCFNSEYSALPACPDDWVFYGRKCYFFSKDTLNWTQSRDNCISMGGHLTIINNKEEQEFLRIQLTSNKETTAFWIGLTDLQTENQWLWVDNSPLKDDI